MKKQITFFKTVLLTAVMLWGVIGDAKATVTITVSNNAVVAGSNYNSIKNAYAYIVSQGALSEPYVIELQSTYNPNIAEETYPITFIANGATATNNITIKPATNAKITIANTNTTNIFTNVTTTTTSAVLTVAQSTANITNGMTVYGYGPFSGSSVHPTVSSFDATTITCSRNMSTAGSGATIYVGTPNTKTILFDGGDYITIDGVSRTDANTGLIIQNPNSIQASTIWFQNSSANNTIQNCFIKGANISGMAYNNGGCGQILFYSGNNDFNTITNNDICDIDGLPMPMAFVLLAYDSNSSNNDNTISYNNFYNLGNATSPNGNTQAIGFSSTNNANSYNNYILNNRFYWTKTAVFRSNPYIFGMGSTYNGLGNRIEGNIIGWQADGVTRAEVTAPLNTALTFYGSNVKNCTFKNNVIGGINYASKSLVGFQLFTSNTSAPNADDVCYGNQVKDITITSSITSGDSRIWGILLSGTSPFDFNVKNNVIKNLVVICTTAYPSYIIGIDYTWATSANKVSYIGNQIYNLTVGTTSSTQANKIWGLRTGIFASTVEKNLIYDLFPLNNTSTTEAYGVFTNNPGIVKWATATSYGTSGTYVYYGNNVYKSTSTGTSGATPPTHTSGTVSDGTVSWAFQYTTTPDITFKNNIVRLGVNNAANNKMNTLIYGIYQNAQFSINDVNKFYHNSVYVGGTASASASKNSFAFYQAGSVIPTTLELKNNIFTNQRTFDTGGTPTGKNYAIGYATASVVRSSDNNLYWASPLALAVSTEKANLAAWKDVVVSGSDAASIEGTPNFMDATATIPDLRIKANTSVVDNVGADLSATVTDDYDGKTRSSYSPHDIGAFAYTYSASASLATDHYRTQASGNWRTNATWQSSTDGSTNWITATAFPSASAGSVTIQNGHTVTATAEATASTLTIDGGGKLTLNDRVGLTATALNLESHGTNGTATFVDGNATGGLTVSGTTTVKQNLSTGRNWYISNPVVATTLPTVAAGTRTLHKYDESIVSDAAGATGWVANPASVEVGKGYVASVSVTGDLTFTGALNTGNKDITLTSRTGTSNKAGFNLIGNPYPSYLDWDAVMAANTDKLRSTTMWYRTKLENAQHEMVYSFWTVNGDGVGVPNGASVKIPPMQSFWVRAIEGGSTLNLTNAMRSHAPETDKLLKAPAAKNTDRTLVRLQVSNGINSDETVIYFSEKAKDGFDSNDAPKMSNGNAAISEIFTTLDNEKIVINSMNTMPLNQEIKLGFVAGNASSFSLKANEITNLPENVKVILKDNAANIETDLSDGTTTYAFEPVATQTDRFSLIFRTAGSTTDVQKPTVAAAQVFVNGNNQITIIAPIKSNYAIYNAMGQIIENGVLKSELQTVNCKLQTGIFVVKVNNQSTRVSIK